MEKENNIRVEVISQNYSSKKDIGLKVFEYLGDEKEREEIVDFLTEKYVSHAQYLESRKEEIIEKIYKTIFEVEWCLDDSLNKMTKLDISYTIECSHTLDQLIEGIYNEQFYHTSSDGKRYLSMNEYLDYCDKCEEFLGIEPLHSYIYNTDRKRFESLMHKAIEVCIEDEWFSSIEEATSEDYYSILCEAVDFNSIDAPYSDLVYISRIVMDWTANEVLNKAKLADMLGVRIYTEEDRNTAEQYLINKYKLYDMYLESNREMVINRIYDSLEDFEWCFEDSLIRMTKRDISKVIASSDYLSDLLESISNDMFLFKSPNNTYNLSYSDFIYDKYIENPELLGLETIWDMIYRTEKSEFESIMEEQIELLVDDGTLDIKEELDSEDYYVILSESSHSMNINLNYDELIFISRRVFTWLRKEQIDKVNLAKRFGVEEYIEADITKYEESKASRNGSSKYRISF